MSFSLSSLLNPAPAAETRQSPEQQRRESLPPVQYVQSPEQHSATAPSTHNHYDYPPVTKQEAAQALASLQSSTLPATAPMSTGYYGFSGAPDYAQQEAAARRSSSSHGRPIELPPPSATTRKASSPSLEQYHVASRSPEQRRPSVVSPQQAAFTLPPIQRFTSHEQPRRTSVVQESPLEHTPSIPANPYIEQAVAEETSTSIPVQESEAMARIKNVARESPAQAVSENGVSAQLDGHLSSPVQVKEERMPTPRDSSPIDARRASVQADSEAHTSKAISSLKSEHSMRTQSPLRESSVPMPSTETPTTEPSKKRWAPSKTKKGTATINKKAPPTKKRKIERSETPASRVSKVPTLKNASSIGTPVNSSPAPSARSYSADPEDEQDDEDVDPDEDVEGDGDVYCICRKPDNGTFMIGCDGTCDDWFHGKCVGIEERDKNLIDKYICPNCAKTGQGRTTWKRICRRSGCRQPARVGKSKNGKEGSKYCSEECGVQYFREMIARTRGREETVKSRSSRRKNSIDYRLVMEDDLGAKGGLLAAGELKALVNTTKTAEDFKKLGGGVLSPPATPTSPNKAATFSSSTADFTESETAALEHISASKNAARTRHQLLKDRMKFITMVKQAASRTATEKELKPKEYCGYDPRLELTEEQFASWRDSKAGKQAFELETLATENSGAAATTNGHVKGEEGDNGFDEEGVYAQIAICDRKKCARHLEWGKLCVDDIRFEMGDNSDNMRALDKEEKEIKERATLRAKAGGNVNGEGSVEIHGLGIMNVDGGDAEAMEGDAEVDGMKEGEIKADSGVGVVETETGEPDTHAKMDVETALEAMAVDAAV